jgi:hypothetical protein
VLRALLAWGDRWVSPEPPTTLRHGDHDLDLDWVCRRCGQVPDEGSVTVHATPPAGTGAARITGSGFVSLPLPSAGRSTPKSRHEADKHAVTSQLGAY